MNSVGDNRLTEKLDHLTGSLDRTACVMSSADRMIDHYRDLTKEKEREITRLKELHELDEEKRQLEADHYKRYRNSTAKSFLDSPNVLSDLPRVSSIPKILKTSHSPKRRYKEKSSSSSNFEITDSSFNYHSTPKNEDNREQINYHLKRIHQQIEADRERRKNQYKDIETLANEMKTLKEVVKDTNVSKSPSNPMFEPPSDSPQMLSAYKRKVQKQQETIRLLTGQLETKVKETTESRSPVDHAYLKSNHVKLLEEQLKKEERERMKIMKEYTDVQQKLSEADRERSELLFALSDVKAEARSILLAYQETSKSLPELKSLLELSAKQKSEYSYQVTKLQSEMEEYKDEIRKLKEKLNEYSTIINHTDSEKQKLNSKLDEIQSKYNEVNIELKNSNEKLLDAKQAFNDLETSKQQLQDKAIITLKSYRSKCRKFEKEIKDGAERYKLQTKEVLHAVSQSKQLEIENLKQTQQFHELANRMEELQGSITLYIDKCDHISHQKNQLEITLSQSNSKKEEYLSMVSELQRIKDENSIIKSELHEEKQKKSEFESLYHEYYEDNVSLKNEKSVLMLEVEKEKNELQIERNNHIQIVNKLQEQFMIYTEDNKLMTETKENLTEQLRISTDHSKAIEEQHKKLTEELEQQKVESNREVARSTMLIQKLRSVANENKKISKEYQTMKDNFDEKLKMFESSVAINEEQTAALKEHVGNAHIDNVATKDNFKTIIDILTHDVNNLLNFLCHEEDNSIPAKELPENILTDYQIEIVELREKLHSCFSITRILKERYNQQRVLIGRARERIKSQVDDISHLTRSQIKESEKHKRQVSELETINQNNANLISNLEGESCKLQKRVNGLTKDLEKCTKVLHKSLEVAKVRKTVLNEIDILNLENQERQKIDENIFRSTEQIEVITEQLGEAKLSFNELKQGGMDTSDYTDRMVESFQSISPTKKHRLVNFGSPLYI